LNTTEKRGIRCKEYREGKWKVGKNPTEREKRQGWRGINGRIWRRKRSRSVRRKEPENLN
jgi:hypothetical protein